MAIKQDNPGLLGTLQRLYSRLSLTALHRRMGSYHKENSAGITMGKDISSSLNGHIDKLANSEHAKCKGVACEEAAKVVPADAMLHTTAQTVADSQNPSPSQDQASLVSTVLDGLAKYFKSGQSEPTIQPHVSEKLKKSTLDHIHTALRHARQGEVTTAKLHADIANQALKEVAHYMSADEYKVFAAEVEALLSELKEHEE